MKNCKNQNFIELTKSEFQQYSSKPITNTEAIEIQRNLFGFLDLLITWKKQTEREAKND